MPHEFPVPPPDEPELNAETVQHLSQVYHLMETQFLTVMLPRLLTQPKAVVIYFASLASMKFALTEAQFLLWLKNKLP